MTETSVIEIVLAIITLGGGVIGWLLSNRDEKQQKAFDEFKEDVRREHGTIWAKHDAEVMARTQLQREIDRDHYPKHELDPKFDALLGAINRLADKVEEMSTSVMKFFSQNKGHTQ